MKVKVTGLDRHTKTEQIEYKKSYTKPITATGFDIGIDSIHLMDNSKIELDYKKRINKITFPNGVELEMVYDEESKMMLTVNVTGPIVEVYESPENGRDTSVCCYIDEEIE